MNIHSTFSGRLSWKRNVVSFLVLFISITAHGTVCAALQSPPQGADPQTLVVGMVSANPKKAHKALKLINDYAVSKMADEGITSGKVMIAKDNRQMVEWLRQGVVDWVVETTFSSLLFVRQSPVDIVLRQWKRGVPSYHSVIVARSDSPYKKLEDLVGQIIAFEDAGSTTSFFLPYTTMTNMGLQLTELTSPRQQPPKDTVGYAFARKEINMSTWVHRKLVAAAALSSTDWETKIPDKQKEDLAIIYQTMELPRSLLLFNRQMAPKQRKALRAVLLEAENTEQGQIALQAFYKTSKIDSLDQETLQSLQKSQKLLDIILNNIPTLEK